MPEVHLPIDGSHCRAHQAANVRYSAQSPCAKIREFCAKYWKQISLVAAGLGSIKAGLAMVGIGGFLIPVTGGAAALPLLILGGVLLFNAGFGGL